MVLTKLEDGHTRGLAPKDSQHVLPQAAGLGRVQVGGRVDSPPSPHSRTIVERKSRTPTLTQCFRLRNLTERQDIGALPGDEGSHPRSRHELEEHQEKVQILYALNTTGYHWNSLKLLDF